VTLRCLSGLQVSCKCVWVYRESQWGSGEFSLLS